MLRISLPVLALWLYTIAILALFAVAWSTPSQAQSTSVWSESSQTFEGQPVFQNTGGTATGYYCSQDVGGCYFNYVSPDIQPSQSELTAPGSGFAPTIGSLGSGGAGDGGAGASGSMTAVVAATSFSGVGEAIAAGAGIMLATVALWHAYKLVKRSVQGASYAERKAALDRAEKLGNENDRRFLRERASERASERRQARAVKRQERELRAELRELRTDREAFGIYGERSSSRGFRAHRELREE